MLSTDITMNTAGSVFCWNIFNNAKQIRIQGSKCSRIAKKSLVHIKFGICPMSNRYFARATTLLPPRPLNYSFS